MGRLNKNKTSQGGFSLISVIVAVAIMSIVAAGTTSLIDHIMKSQNNQKFLGDLENFQDELRANLSSKTACVNTFGGTNLNSGTDVTFNAIRNSTGGNFVQVGPVPDVAFSVESIRLHRYADQTFPQGSAQVEIQFRSKVAVHGASVVSRSLTLQTQKTAGALSDCITFARMTDGIWRVSPTNTQDVFFTSGNVGVGTTDATATLEVKGQIVSKEHVVNAGRIADFKESSQIVLRSVRSSSIQLRNMVAGGVYNVIVEDTARRIYTFQGCGTQYFSPENKITTNRTVYTIYRRGNSACYIAWATGFK